MTSSCNFACDDKKTLKISIKIEILSRAVEYAVNLNIEGSNSTGWWACFLFHLFLLPFISEMSLIRSLKEVHLQVCAVKAIKMNA